MKVRGQIFRKNIATRERNQIMANIRQKMVRYMQARQNEAEINGNIEKCIRDKNIQACYQEFLHSNRQIFSFISQELVIPSYQLFTSHLENSKCIEMLQHLAIKYFEDTFVNRQLNLLNRAILNSLCGLVEICISQIISQEYYSQSQSVQTRLSSYLGIIGMYFQPKYKKYSLQQTCEQDKYKINEIMSWSEHLLGNKPYLQILANIIDNHQNKQKSNSHLITLLNDQTFTHKLLNNIFSTHQEISFISCYILLNLIESNPIIKEKQLQQLLPNMLKILYYIYDKYTHSTSFYKQFHFIKCLKCLKIVLDQMVIRNKCNINLSYLIVKYKLFNILRFVNQICYFPQKYLIFQIIELVIQIIVELQDQSEYHVEIPQEIKQSLSLGLQNNFNLSVSLSCLRTIKRLVRNFKNSEEIISQMIDYGVPTILQSLQFNSNEQISSTSISLLQSEFRQQNYDDHYYYCQRYGWNKEMRTL